MFSQFVGMAVQGSFRNVLEKLAQAGRLSKMGAGGDPLHQLPSFIDL